MTLLAGYFAFAADAGSKDNPLVTLSYIDEVLKPNILKSLDQAADTKAKEIGDAIDARLAEALAQIDARLTELDSLYVNSPSGPDKELVDKIIAEVRSQLGDLSTSGASGGDTYSVVRIAAGKRLTAQVGCEFVLRIGNAKCYATATPGLIDLTSGAEINNGDSLVKNHLYLVTIDGRGFTASDDVTVVLRGPYTIS